jgi:two-component system chemotaxis sensor kinase CheA
METLEIGPVTPAQLLDTPCFVVICDVAGALFGLVVTGVLTTEDIIVKPVAPLLQAVPFYLGMTMLGDGSVIMILDPNAFPPALSNNEAAAIPKHDTTATTTSPATTALASLLLVRIHGDQHAAIPLMHVVRLETLYPECITIQTGGMVAQYRDTAMPLVFMRHAPFCHDTPPMQMVVCRHEARHYGVVVDGILDIVQYALQDMTPGHDSVHMGNVVIAGVTTMVLDIPTLLHHHTRSALRATEHQTTEHQTTEHQTTEHQTTEHDT